MENADNKRSTILYIAMSLDGFIAKKDGDISFLSIVEKENEDYGYSNFIKTIDTVIMGRKTYDKVLSFGIPFPHADKKTYIITRSSKPDQDNLNLTFYADNIENLVNSLKREKGGNIFVDGGAEIVNLLFQKNLFDELIISVIPVLLGSGIPLFNQERPEVLLNLVSNKQFSSGLVQLHYKIS